MVFRCALTGSISNRDVSNRRSFCYLQSSSAQARQCDMSTSGETVSPELREECSMPGPLSRS